MLSTYPNRALGRSARTMFAAVIALIMVAAFGAANSNAAFTAPYTAKCSGADVTGQGASLQATLQPALINYWRTTDQGGQTGGCGSAVSIPNITYTSTGSGAGRSTFGADGLGRSATDRYVAFDEAPTVAQRTAMEAAQGTRPGNVAPSTGAGKLGVSPVAAAAVSVIVNFPVSCELPATDPDFAPYARFQVSNARMEAVWTGSSSVDTWGEFLPGIQAIPNNVDEKTDADCKSQVLKRVVRFDSSGTTFAFKHFLNGINGSTGWLSLGNTAWPNGGTTVNAGTAGGGSLAQKVIATPGSIGYADLATARVKNFQKSSDTSPSDPAASVYDDSNAIAGYPTSGKTFSYSQSRFWVPLEAATAGAGVTGSGTYVEPSVDKATIRNNKKGANCATVTYNNVPLNAGLTPDQFGDWSVVNGSLSLDQYPSCTLTYVGFWDDYADVYGNTLTEQSKARTVRDYLLTSVNSGQNVLNPNDYSRLPTTLKNGATSALNGTSWNK